MKKKRITLVLTILSIIFVLGVASGFAQTNPIYIQFSQAP